MAKRYLGGGVSFEQKDVYQEFSEDPGGGGGSSTLSGLTDVDISNPTDGQILVYNAESGKWENGAGGGGSVIPIFTLTQTSQTGGTATCNMTFDSIVAAIQSGTLTVAKFLHNDGGGYQYAPLSYYAAAFDEEPGVVVFVGCELQEGGDIMWHGVTMVPQEISYTIRRTISYPGN